MKTDLTAPHFSDPEAARVYLEKQVWAQGVICPHCGLVDGHYKLEGKSTRPGLYKCNGCREPFTVTVGSVFERSKVPLNKWLLAVHLMSASKKGISAHQLHRMLGVTYKTAWFMAHRIREAMSLAPKSKLGSDGGPVEADETYWGNIPGRPIKQGAGHKMKVLSLVDRTTGEKRSFRVANLTAKTLRGVMKEQISEKARLHTDELRTYKWIGRDFAKHEFVSHRAHEYSRGDVTTNTVESSFALLKRGLVGTFHKVSEAHLQRYATEFDFRWNHRRTDDDTRAAILASQIGGKRLTYRRTDSQASA